MNTEQGLRLTALRQLIGANPTRITINGQGFTVFREDMTVEEVQMAGGHGDAGGVRFTVPKPDMSEPPEGGADVEVDGQTYQVLRYIERNGISYEVECGDIVATEDPDA